MLADNMMDLHVVRLAVWHCAWVLDQGRGPMSTPAWPR